MGIADRYVAQIDIPAREYKEVTTKPIEGEEGTDSEEDNVKLEPVPFSMDKVTLTLWTIEGGYR